MNTSDKRSDRRLDVVWIVFAVVILGILFYFAYQGEAAIETITYEQLTSGAYNGETVKMIGRPTMVIPDEGPLVYIWYVQKEDGTFAQVSEKYGDWMITKSDYEDSPTKAQQAIDTRDEMLLRIEVETPESVNVRSFKVIEDNYDQGKKTKRKNAEDEGIGGILLIGAVVFAAMIAGASLIDKKDKEKKGAFENLKKSIEKTKIVDSSHTATASSRTSTASAATRAAVGSMLGGPLGGFVGASTAKQRTTVRERHMTTFMIYYTNGERRHETVENGSKEYNLYMEKLEL